MLISLDPGVTAAGVAIFEDGELSRAFLARGDGWHDTARAALSELTEMYPFCCLHAELAVEVPQIYQQRKTDANDLITLALMAGAFAGGFCGEITTYLPREWKGQVPKPIMIERIKKKLSSDELTRVELPSARGLHHNVYDAIGIGQHHAGKAKSRHRT